MKASEIERRIEQKRKKGRQKRRAIGKEIKGKKK